VVSNAVSTNTASAIVRRDGAGGFAAGGLTLSGKIDQTSIDGLVARRTLGSGVIPATGAGTRLMWYPRKAAFRGGYADGTQWDDASVGDYSTAMGYNTTASGSMSTAMGYGSTASGFDSIAMGFGPTASGNYSTAMDYNTTASGDQSTAMGSYASTSSSGIARAGAFVYGDSSTLTRVFPSADNQFVVRAAGGTTFYSNSLMSTGVTLAANGTSWGSVSDRNRKEDFLPVDGEVILHKLAALPVTSWRYKNNESRQRYIGPMAQDFHALFGLGTDTTIATLDVDGVTLAGIKALERRTAELQTEATALRTENAAVRDQLERLMRRVEQMEAKRNAAQ
jgi:hypothetical protein